MSLSGNILATLAYHDSLDRALTSFEVWKYLIDDSGEGERSSLGETVTALSGRDLAGRIAEVDGFYTLCGREELALRRIRSEKTATAKLHRIRRLAKALRIVPFVRMIGVTGSLAMRRGDAESDWDLFVVIRTGRIFSGRTCLTGFLQAIGKRRHGARSKDRACLNYFVTEDGLEIPTEDLFSANEYSFLIPLFGRETFRRFELKNRWIAKRLPNRLPTEVLPLWSVPESCRLLSVRRFFERVIDVDAAESWLRSWQRRKIMRNPNTAIEGGRIEATDRALVFLPHPHGPSVYERFRRRLSEVRLR
ncbi:MAG: hypothetical protein HGB18_04705 [Candidatus Moranbacteria bacterium]|nr:hypothetical protein [Candidatus Moranbacteria bacterium]